MKRVRLSQHEVCNYFSLQTFVHLVVGVMAEPSFPVHQGLTMHLMVLLVLKPASLAYRATTVKTVAQLTILVMFAQWDTTALRQPSTHSSFHVHLGHTTPKKIKQH